MIEALVSGKVYKQPQARQDQKGRTFALGKVKAATSTGETLFVSCIVFGEAAERFLKLNDGDAVALAGSITPKTWTDSQGQAHAALDMQVQQVLSVYQARAKRTGGKQDE